MPEDLRPIHEIAKKYRKSPETIRLWITRGILVNGQRIHLNGRKIGGVWAVSETEMLQWFEDTFSLSMQPGLVAS